MKPIVCKLCGRRLSHYADENGMAYVHPADVVANHEPEAVEAPEDWRGICDFCGSDDPVWVLPANDFRLPGASQHQSLGDWATCGACGLFIGAGRWTALTMHVVSVFEKKLRRLKALEPASRLALLVLHQEVRRHVRGQLRPLSAERNDEGGGSR